MLALADPGVPRQAVPDPERVDGADARRRPARAREPGELPVQRPRPGRHRRVPSAGGRRRATPAASEHAENQPCPRPTPSGQTSTSSSGSWPVPGDTLSIRDGHAVVNGKRPEGDFTSVPAHPELQFPAADQDSAWSLFYDGRQPWGERRQPLLGTRPEEMDHRTGLLHLLAARANRHPLSRPRPAAAAAEATVRAGAAHAPAACFGSTAGSSRRFVAGADEAGRGSLAGPLVAAAVLFDYERLTHARGSRADAPRRLQGPRPRAARGALPARDATRGAGRRHLALRARDRRARPARDEPRRAPRLPGAGRRARTALCLVDGFRVPDCGHGSRR